MTPLERLFIRADIARLRLLARFGVDGAAESAERLARAYIHACLLLRLERMTKGWP